MSVRRKTFRPVINVEDNKTHNDNRENLENFDEVVYKGGDTDELRIDMQNLDKMVAELRKNSDVKISELKGDLNKNFRKLVSYVNLLVGSDGYETLHEVVKKHFKDCENPVPGTVAGYCAGCMVETTFSKGEDGKEGAAGCSLICANAMPQPKSDDNWTFCNYNVVFSTYDDVNNTYNFTSLNNKADKTRSILYINYTDPSKFPGFTTEDKNKLLAMGIKEVVLFGYDKDDVKEYVDLYNGSLTVENIKHRLTSAMKQKGAATAKHDDDDLASHTLLLLISLSFIFLILYFMWVWMKSPR